MKNINSRTFGRGHPPRDAGVTGRDGGGVGAGGGPEDPPGSHQGATQKANLGHLYSIRTSRLNNVVGMLWNIMKQLPEPRGRGAGRDREGGREGLVRNQKSPAAASALFQIPRRRHDDRGGGGGRQADGQDAHQGDGQWGRENGGRTE